MVPAAEEHALDVADEQVDKLLDAGCRPGDILVLTTGEPHPWQQHEQSFGDESYWKQFEEGGDVFYAHVRGRPSGRRLVVLAVNGGSAEDTARSLALALAATELIVVGDPERLRSLL